MASFYLVKKYAWKNSKFTVWIFFCQRYKPKEKKTPTRSHWGSKLLAGVHLSNKTPTTYPKKSKSRFVQTPYQVSESPELTRIVSQFIEANRAPREAEKDF
jgi:putative transposase